MWKIQEAQRKQKEEIKEKHREKSIEGMKRKQVRIKSAQDDENEAEEEEDDDAEYYRSEVGQEPEQGTIIKNSFVVLLFMLSLKILDLFTKRAKSTKSSLSGPAAKRAKIEKKKMADKKNKDAARKFKSKDNDKSTHSRLKESKFDKFRKSSGKQKSKVGFKGASKVHRKR